MFVYKTYVFLLRQRRHLALRNSRSARLIHLFTVGTLTARYSSHGGKLLERYSII